MSDAMVQLGLIGKEEAMAEVLRALTQAERVKMLSVLKNRKDVDALCLCYSVADKDHGMGWPWLALYADIKLQLLCSQKGARAKDIVKALQNMAASSKDDKIRKYLSFLE